MAEIEMVSNQHTTTFLYPKLPQESVFEHKNSTTIYSYALCVILYLKQNYAILRNIQIGKLETRETKGAGALHDGMG